MRQPLGYEKLLTSARFVGELAHMSATITRHFATVRKGRWGDRQVHYRRAGRGPVVICLHQSPLSSRDMIPAMTAWHKQFTCIAPDSPGYGLSDPLGVPRAEMPDFADAVIEFMDAIGVQKAAVYGFHTGAMIAMALAEKYPDRVTCAVANGFVILTDAERTEIVANYLPPLEPSWDGAHLTWLWSRMREQTIFFPWYSKRTEDRMSIAVPSPDALQRGLLDFLRAGDHYRVGYRAAFTMDSAGAAERVRAPTLLTASRFDATAMYLSRVVDASPAVTVAPGDTFDSTLDDCRKFIKKARPPAAPKLVATAPIPGQLHQETLSVPGGQLRLRRNDEARGRTVLVLHDAIGSSDSSADIARSLIGKRPVLALDLPGHGESDDTFGRSRVTIEAHAKAVRAALKALKISTCDVVGVGSGSLVALELAALAPKVVRRLVLTDLPYLSKAQQTQLRDNAPKYEVDWYGGHLLQAWHFVRDQGLFFPWFQRVPEGALRPAHVDTASVHSRVVDFVKAPQRTLATYLAQFSYPLRKKLAKAKVAMLLGAREGAALEQATRQASKEHGHAPFVTLPADPRQWDKALLPFLDA